MESLHLEVLPSAQRRVWESLHQVPRTFVLYGGTAIALQLGHRQSVDFDFFCAKSFDDSTFAQSGDLLHGAITIRKAPGTWTVRVDRGGPVMLSFLEAPFVRQLRTPLSAKSGPCRIASLLDLGAAKASVVQQRAEAKDYLDVDALIASGLTLAEILAASRLAHGERFDPQSTLKALCYFGDGDLPTLPIEVQTRLSRAVRAVDLARLPVLQIEPMDIGA